MIALIAGGVACRTTGSDRLSGPLVCCLIGIAGLFGSQLLFFQLNLATYFEAIAAIRMVVDVCAAYLISLFIAALISAIDPS